MSYQTPEEAARQRVREADMRRVAEEMIERDKQAGFAGGNPTPLASVFSPERQAIDDKGAQHLIGMTFKSSHEGPPHIVSELPDGRVQCTCQAMLSIETRPQGCWAMVQYRRVKGLHV